MLTNFGWLAAYFDPYQLTSTTSRLPERSEAPQDRG